MAHGPEVRFIEAMSPEQTEIAARECQRVVRVLASTQGSIDRAKRTVVWADRSRELFDRRLHEADQMSELILEGYDKAGKALEDYAAAQREAQRLVGEGFRAERQLGSLLSALTSRPAGDQLADPMGFWLALRADQPFWEALAQRVDNNEIYRAVANIERLYQEAGTLYDRALRVEAEARRVAVTALTQARRRLPEFHGDRFAVQAIISGTPGLRTEVLEASKLNLDMRRPGDGVLEQYQVIDDPRRQNFPADLPSPLSHEVQTQEDELLWELGREQGALAVLRVKALKDFAEAEAMRRFPGPQLDNHADAFRHTYANALFTQEFGEDWTRRFMIAHETWAGNPAAVEAMDLHNNEVGRMIALANPRAPESVLAELVEQEVRDGRTVVVGRDGRSLDFSDQIEAADIPKPVENFRLPGRQQLGPREP